MEINQNFIIAALLVIFILLVILVVYIYFIYDKTSVLTKISVSQEQNVGVGSTSI